MDALLIGYSTHGDARHKPSRDSVFAAQVEASEREGLTNDDRPKHRLTNKEF